MAEGAEKLVSFFLFLVLGLVSAAVSFFGNQIAFSFKSVPIGIVGSYSIANSMEHLFAKEDYPIGE